MSLSDEEYQLEICKDLLEKRRRSPFYKYYWDIKIPQTAKPDLDTHVFNVSVLEEKGFIELSGNNAKITASGIDWVKQKSSDSKNVRGRFEVVKDDVSKVGLRGVPQIFICHSSLDKSLLEEIKKVIEEKEVNPFFANQEQFGMNPCEKIMAAMNTSDALFAVLTKNALKNVSTRDWIFFEIGLAKGMWRKYDLKYIKNANRKVWQQYRIYGWKDPAISLPDDSLIKFITDYQPLKSSRKSRDEMLEKMKEIASKISWLKQM